MKGRSFAAAAVLALALVATGAAAAASRALDPQTRFFVPGFETPAKQQWAKLLSEGRRADADLLARMENTSHAVWFTGGSADDARVGVQKTVLQATAKGQVPVLVAYDLPYRDCGQYSAGGAADTAAYLAWIDGFARGIGDRPAVVILEPDGLGIIPYNTDLQGVHEWCQPALAPGLAPAEANAQRYVQLNAAVDRLERQPNVSVYLDGTHSRWLGAGEAAYRLVKAGVLRAQGFFVNVSNYQPTPQLVQYGTWVSKCIWFAANPGSWGNGHFDWCASQYYPANVNDPSTWALTDQWYRDNVESQTWVPYPGDAGLTHFVIDTSRNGRGAWTPSTAYPDAQDWCNPPGRGLGLRPTAATGSTLVDAYLWVKVPGESDGSCNRGIAGSDVDPEWAALTGDPSFVDPSAGAWFPQQALQLARLASPPLSR